MHCSFSVIFRSIYSTYLTLCVNFIAFANGYASGPDYCVAAICHYNHRHYRSFVHSFIHSTIIHKHWMGKRTMAMERVATVWPIAWSRLQPKHIKSINHRIFLGYLGVDDDRVCHARCVRCSVACRCMICDNFGQIETKPLVIEYYAIFGPFI